MNIIISIVWIIGAFIIGFAGANLIRLKKVGKVLEELDVKDPEFEAKMKTIRKFNYMWR